MSVNALKISPLGLTQGGEYKRSQGDVNRFSTAKGHPDEKVLWFREGQFNTAEILSGEACTVSLRDPPGSIKPLYEWSLSPDFPKLAGFMIGDESRFRRILGVSKDGDNVIYEVGRARVDGQPTIGD